MGARWTVHGHHATSYWYCIAGDTLTVTPQTSMPITTGTIGLQTQ